MTGEPPCAILYGNKAKGRPKMPQDTRTLCMGLLAHVDAGKTTLTERLLFDTGAVRVLGSVDEGNTHTDTLDIERARGISVESALTVFEYRDLRVNLLDTPGHIDFSAQVERALWALDAAVLLVSAPDGVQPYTITLSRALERLHIPYLIFINKCDRPGSDPEAVLDEIREALHVRAFMLPATQTVTDAWSEALCDGDDVLTEIYLENGSLSFDQARKATLEQLGYGLVPVLYGSAATGDGSGRLLEAISDWLRPAPKDPGTAPDGRIFGIIQDRALGRGAYVKLESGTVRNRDSVKLPGRTGRVLQIRGIFPGGVRDTGELKAGDVGIVFGWPDCRTGERVGESADLEEAAEGILQQPLLRVRVDPEDPEDLPELRAALEQLSAEDPLLDVYWSARLRTLEVGIMGMIQQEILLDMLQRRFGLKVVFGSPQIIYRETPAMPAEGVCIYTMPKPCWAMLWVRIAPLPRGSGVRYRCTAAVDRLSPRYRRQVEQTVPLALRQGRLGWEVTDIDIEVYDGEDHVFHTHPRDFILATPWAIQDALRNAGSKLLEPMLRAEITVPESAGPKLMNELLQMRASYEETSADGGYLRVLARMPASSSLDFPQRLAALTSGKGRIWTRFDGYEECTDGETHTTPRRGVDPLDTAKYILAMRNAVDAGAEDSW